MGKNVVSVIVSVMLYKMNPLIYIHINYEFDSTEIRETKFQLHDLNIYFFLPNKKNSVFLRSIICKL